MFVESEVLKFVGSDKQGASCTQRSSRDKELMMVLSFLPMKNKVYKQFFCLLLLTGMWNVISCDSYHGILHTLGPYTGSPSGIWTTRVALFFCSVMCVEHVNSVSVISFFICTSNVCFAFWSIMSNMELCNHLWLGGWPMSICLSIHLAICAHFSFIPAMLIGTTDLYFDTTFSEVDFT